MVKNGKESEYPHHLFYVIHRQKLEINAARIRNFQICLLKCIQKDSEVQKNKPNKSQWDGIYFFLIEKRNKTPQIFPKPCNYTQYSL